MLAHRVVAGDLARLGAVGRRLPLPVAVDEVDRPRWACRRRTPPAGRRRRGRPGGAGRARRSACRAATRAAPPRGPARAVPLLLGQVGGVEHGCGHRVLLEGNAPVPSAPERPHLQPPVARIGRVDRPARSRRSARCSPPRAPRCSPGCRRTTGSRRSAAAAALRRDGVDDGAGGGRADPGPAAGPGRGRSSARTPTGCGFTADGAGAGDPAGGGRRHAPRGSPALALRRVADLCCGIGGDLVALAGAVGAGAVGVDRDPVTAAVAEANAAALGRRPTGSRSAARTSTDDRPGRASTAVFVDPARRGGGRRTFDPRAWSPPYSFVLDLARPGAGDRGQAGPGMPHGCCRSTPRRSGCPTAATWSSARCGAGRWRPGVRRRATAAARRARR